MTKREITILTLETINQISTLPNIEFTIDGIKQLTFIREYLTRHYFNPNHSEQLPNETIEFIHELQDSTTTTNNQHIEILDNLIHSTDFYKPPLHIREKIRLLILQKKRDSLQIF